MPSITSSDFEVCLFYKPSVGLVLAKFSEICVSAHCNLFMYFKDCIAPDRGIWGCNPDSSNVLSLFLFLSIPFIAKIKYWDLVNFWCVFIATFLNMLLYITVPPPHCYFKFGFLFTSLLFLTFPHFFSSYFYFKTRKVKNLLICKFYTSFLRTFS
jgi:hypothetical protein